MAANGERQRSGDNQHSGGSATRLADLGIPKDRASRAMQLADVPQAEFDAAAETVVYRKPAYPPDDYLGMPAALRQS